jgi:hypothetical protein
MMEKINAWMPLQKDIDGGFVGVLSDDSIDRDGEFMSKELLISWVKEQTVLPMLANHENKLEKLIGGWTDKRLVEKGNSTAMVAKPFFLESNPLGRQAKAMVEEALSKGLNVGISIGAIPHGNMVEKEINGKKYKGYTSAEILEATIVPIQSNRNASFGAVAKKFDIELDKEHKEDIQMVDEIKKETEDVESVSEEVKVDVPETPETIEEVAEVVTEDDVEEDVEEDAKADVKETPQEIVDAVKALNEANDKIAKLESEVAKLNKKAINLPIVEGPINKEAVIDNTPLTVEKMLKLKYGGK